MRAIITLSTVALIAATAACQATEDKNNGETSVQYNEQVAANAVADVGNTATNIVGTIAADAKREAGKISDKVGEARTEHDGNSAATINSSDDTVNKH